MDKKDTDTNVTNDYRNMFTPKKKTVNTKELKVAENAVKAVKNATKNAQEGFDLLNKEDIPVDPERDDFLPKGEQDETEILEKEPENPKQTLPETRQGIKHRGQHRVALSVGVIVLLFALVGVGFLATTIGKQVYRVANDDSRLRSYDKFISPVVMQDPSPFKSPEEADELMVLKASLWQALETNGASYSDYDKAGRTLVPLADVVDACHTLFGPKCEPQAKNPAKETYFTYDAEAHVFHVTPYSSQDSFSPYTEKIRKEGDNTVLRVGYISAENSERSAASEGKKPVPVKYMDYVLHPPVNGGKEYIIAVRAAK